MAAAVCAAGAEGQCGSRGTGVSVEDCKDGVHATDRYLIPTLVLGKTWGHCRKPWPSAVSENPIPDMLKNETPPSTLGVPRQPIA